MKTLHNFLVNNHVKRIATKPYHTNDNRLNAILDYIIENGEDWKENDKDDEVLYNMIQQIPELKDAKNALCSNIHGNYYVSCDIDNPCRWLLCITVVNNPGGDDTFIYIKKPYIDYEIKADAPNAENVYKYFKDANSNHYIKKDTNSTNYRFGVTLK